MLEAQNLFTPIRSFCVPIFVLGFLVGTMTVSVGSAEPEVVPAERAIALGLAWIVDHQLPNGAWAYTQLINPDCRGKCKDTPLDKFNKSQMSATAIALLSLIANGNTHKNGVYKKAVKDGLDYITRNMQNKVEDGIPVVILCEKDAAPEMYHHSLATIVLCEVAARTRDRSLDEIAQSAVYYICWAQDPVSGGWRYSPRQAGSTSSFGWNLMALKSAQMNYLNVPPITINRARHFLNNVADKEGVLHGYMNDDPNGANGLLRNIAATTSIGLLDQLYCGRKIDDPVHIKGTDQLVKWGPRADDLYYSYYATKVMSFTGGEKWENWKSQMHKELLSKQITVDGHEKGSWPYEGGILSDQGGRLTSTTFATMILGVHESSAPHRKSGTAESFPLDD